MQENKINFEVGYGIGKGAGDDAFTIGVETAQQALSHIKEHPLSAVLVFASAHYDLGELLRGIKKLIGNAPLAGATTAGEICNEPQQESVVVVALASPHLRMKVGIGKGVSRNWQEALTQAVNIPEVAPFFSPQSDTIWSELTRKGQSAFGLLFSPGNTQTADSYSFEILEELKRLSLGRLPFIGGGAADDWRMKTNHILCNGGPFPDSLLLAVFETRLQFGISLAHGFRPSLQRALTTCCRDHEVLELDNRPADEIYSRIMGIPRETLAGRHLTLTTGRPLGTPDLYGQYSLNVASYFTEARGVRFAQPVTDGAVLTVMEANQDELVAAGPEALRKALLRGSIVEPSLVLVFSCALRTRLLGERFGEEISEVRNLVPKVPVLGFYSFGEQGLSDDGVNRHNNMVIGLLAIGGNLSYAAQVALENERLRLEVMETTALKQVNEALQREIAERRRAEETLKESEQRLHFLTSELLKVQEKERRRLATDLHDELGQSLLVLKMKIREIERDPLIHQSALKEECRGTLLYLDELVENIRRLSHELSPALLEDLGLTAALKNLFDRFSEYLGNENFSIVVEEIDDLFSQEVQISIYRILQECLTNIGKYASPTRVAVTIKRGSSSALFSVEDDGVGFEVEEVLAREAYKKGLGLAAIDERVRILGGSLDIWSQEGKGTKITFTVPVNTKR
jgi:two-component sensor histidine kinase